MNHPPDDELLKHALELLDEDETRAINAHLKECAECRTRFVRIQAEANLLGSIRAAAKEPAFPQQKAPSRVLYVALRAAALLLIGFLAGFGTSNLTNAPQVNVIAAYGEPSPPADSLTRYAVSDATEIRLPLGAE